MITSRGARPVEPDIQRTLKLRQASEHGNTINNDLQSPQVELPTGQAGRWFEEGGIAPSLGDEAHIFRLVTDLDAQREDIQKINSAGYEVISTIDDAIRHIEKESSNSKNSISQLRRDLQNSNSRTDDVVNDTMSIRDELERLKRTSEETASRLNHLENSASSERKALMNVREDLTSDIQRSKGVLQQEYAVLKAELDAAHNEVEYLRHELDDAKKVARDSAPAMKTYVNDVASLRAELGRLREELSYELPRQATSSDGMFSSREIDILTRNITRIGQRANQVEPLQMEVEILKGKLQRMESQKESTRDDVLNRQQQRLLATSPEEPRRKRSSVSQGRNVVELNRSSNNFRTKGSTTGNLLPSGIHKPTNTPLSTRTRTMDPSIPKPRPLTKSGAIDKRFLKGAERPTLRKRRAKG